MEVSNEWLGTKRGIQGYNEMMLSKAFYEQFTDAEYILICHLDAWIFRDELKNYCYQDYDLVAAPWPLRPRYRHFPLKQWLALRKQLAGKSVTRQQMYGRIGNGGLCLRRVRTFADACERYASEAAEFLKRSPNNALYNEDIFWALVPDGFRLPSIETAAAFSFDLKPELCYAILTGGKLPMGCHGFLHKSRRKFWKHYIPEIFENL